MRRTILLLTILLALPLSAATKIDDLAWMSGHWQITSGGVTTEEVWLAPKGGTLLGMNRTVKGDRTTMYEFLRIAEWEGKIVYFGSPGGRPATPFPLKEAGPGRAVFENLQHDFPQRIVYWRRGQSLCARVEGKIGGRDEGEEWCWRRMDGRP